MNQEIKLKLEQAAAYHQGSGLDFMAGAQTILENPGEWGLQEIPDYYCAEKDRIGYVCEDGPCDRCELLIQQDAVATRNEILVDSENEIIELQAENTRLREALEKMVNTSTVDAIAYPLQALSEFYTIAKEALKQ